MEELRRWVATCMAVVGLAVGTSAACAHPNVYYVDPIAGRNTNSGLSPDAPWQNPPGTRTPDDTGFVSAAWGAITERNKVQPGDTILLRGGRTQTKAHGGAWRIDPSFYAPDATEARPITIRVATATEWPGSVGAFVLDGTGVRATGSLFVGRLGAGGLVDVEKLNYVKIGGAGPERRLVVRNVSRTTEGGDGNGVMVDSNTGMNEGFIGQWLDIAGCEGHGFSIANHQYFVVRHSVSHDNLKTGFQTGYLVANRPVSDGAFVDCEAYGNGRIAQTASDNDNPPGDAFLIVSALHSFWVLRCKAHDNYLQGLNFGEQGNPNPQTVSIRRFETWKNGAIARPFSSRSGLISSGLEHESVYVFYSVFYRNPCSGTWFPHQAGTRGPGASAYYYNCTFFGNGWAPGGAELWYTNCANQQQIRNSIICRRPKTGCAWTYSTPETPDRAYWLKPYSNYNLYCPAASDADTFSTFRFGPAGFERADVSFAQAAAGAAGFTGPMDRIGGGLDPMFLRTDESDYGRCDFRLGGGSPAIDRGTFFLRAKGAGTRANIVRVVGSDGGPSDPRRFFIGPRTFREAKPDVIQIEGAGRVTITGMSADSISFRPAATWKDGAGIHLPWSGAAPDLGAFEHEPSHGIRPPGRTPKPRVETTTDGRGRGTRYAGGNVPH